MVLAFRVATEHYLIADQAVALLRRQGLQAEARPHPQAPWEKSDVFVATGEAARAAEVVRGAGIRPIQAALV